MRLIKALILLLLFACFLPPSAFACISDVENSGQPRIYKSSLSTDYGYLQSCWFDRESSPSMNLRRVTEDGWLRFSDQFGEQVELKKKIYQRRPHKVFGVNAWERDLTLKASYELLAKLVEYLPRVHPNHFRKEGSELVNLITKDRWEVDNPPGHPLVTCGMLVPDDFTLVRVRKNKMPHLVGGFLAFPSNWILPDFIGYSLTDIHEAVTGYKVKLSAGVDRLMENFKPGMYLERNNRLIYHDPTLSLPSDHRQRPAPEVNFLNTGDKVFLRVERQTLTILPESGYIVFTIHPHVYPLREVAKYPLVAGELARALQKDSEKEKAFHYLSEAALRYLWQYRDVYPVKPPMVARPTISAEKASEPAAAEEKASPPPPAQ